MAAVFVGAGEVWSGVGTLVVARAGEERGSDPAWSKPRQHGRPQGIVLPFFGESQMGDHVSRNAGDHKGPHSAPHLSCPYGYRRHLSASSPLCCFHLLSLMDMG